MAGPGSPASARSRAPCGTLSTRSSPPGTRLPSPGEPTPASTRPGRSRASASQAGRRPSVRARRSTRRFPAIWPCSRSSRRPRVSAPASPPARAPIATGSSAAASARRSPTDVRSGGRARSISTRSRTAAALIPGRHDFTAFTPTETQHRIFIRDGLERCLGGARRGAALHDRGRELPPAHGANARRDDARRERDLAPLLERPAAERGGHDRAAVGPLPRARGLLSRLASIERCASRSSSSTSTAP